MTSADFGKAFRIDAKLRNNRIIRAREVLGYTTCAEAARALGLSYHELVKYEALAQSPWSHAAAGGWKSGAKKIASALGYEPEDLWPEVTWEVAERRATVEIAAPQVFFLDTDSPDLARALREELAKLHERDRNVIERHFGIGRDSETLEEIAEAEGYTRANAGRLVARGLRHLRVGSSQRRLRPFHNPDAVELLRSPSMPCPSCAKAVTRVDAHHPFEALVEETSTYVECARGDAKIVRRWLCDRSKRSTKKYTRVP